jgi:hypothetical protein
MNPKFAQNFDSIAASLERRRNMHFHHKTLELLKPVTSKFTKQELDLLSKRNF